MASEIHTSYFTQVSKYWPFGLFFFMLLFLRQSTWNFNMKGCDVMVEIITYDRFLYIVIF